MAQGAGCVGVGPGERLRGVGVREPGGVQGDLGRARGQGTLELSLEHAWGLGEGMGLICVSCHWGSTVGTSITMAGQRPRGQGHGHYSLHLLNPFIIHSFVGQLFIQYLTRARCGSGFARELFPSSFHDLGQVT